MNRALHHDTLLFQLAAEHSPIAMGLATPGGRLRELNGALERFTGRTREDLLARDWQSLTHPDDLTLSLQTHRRLLAGECDHYRLTKRYLHADGSVIWGDLTVSAVKDPEGRLWGTIFQLVDATEIVQTRRQLESGHERFRQLAELGSDLMVMLDTSLRAVWISADSEGRTALGWPADAELGVSLDQRVHPDDRPRLAELSAALLASGQWPRDCLLRMRTASGGYRWMAVMVAPLRESDGTISGYVSGLRDVDELVRTREREAAERQRLRATLDSLLDPHVVIEAVRDSEGKVVDFRYLAVNPMACQAMGQPMERLLGARVLPVVPALRDPELFGRYLHTLESGEPLAIDNLVIAEAVGQPLRHFDLRVVKLGDGLVVTWRDISERAEMSETIELLTRSSGELVVRLDLDGIIRWVSPSLPALLGWQPQQWLGRRGTDFLEHGGACPGYQQARPRLLAGERVVCEERIRTADGSLRWLESYVTPHIGRSGAVEGLVLACRLIDERRAAQEALERKSEELRRKLRTSLAAAAIAHEIKKPLSLLLLHSRLVQRQLADATAPPAALATLIPAIEQNARTVVETIERMNALLRSVPTEPVRLDLGSVVRSTLLYQRPRLERRGIRLETAALEAEWLVQGDGTQLQIALNNLIDNAIEAMAEVPAGQARLRLSLERVDQQVQLSVDDNGPGLPSPSSEQLLLRTSKPTGTGMGLFVVEQILANLGGNLELGRSSLGGASVRLRLPLAPPLDERDQAGGSPAPPAVGGVERL
ncbi:PAS domain S-box protein [Cyanobium sp. FGCU-52]|nr:PAS domain S-box protein [Cyanobium sp. FGCU52]